MSLFAATLMVSCWCLVGVEGNKRDISRAGLGLVLLPFLGVVLNGTSSVLYGAVPELVRKSGAGRACAWLSTGVIGSGRLAPILFGAAVNGSGRTVGAIAAACTTAAIIPR